MAELRDVLPNEAVELPRRVDSLIERFIDDELVLYDPGRQRVHALNPTAAFVWRACNGQHDEEGIIAELSQRYPESRQAIEADIPEILALFRFEGLLKT